MPQILGLTARHVRPPRFVQKAEFPEAMVALVAVLQVALVRQNMPEGRAVSVVLGHKVAAAAAVPLGPMALVVPVARELPVRVPVLAAAAVAADPRAALLLVQQQVPAEITAPAVAAGVLASTVAME